jgi:hypothetical protein
MQTFLDGVAERIVASSHSMDQVKIIVPSVRAIHYLRESFKKVIDQPLIAPEIISISEFIKALSGINTTINCIRVCYHNKKAIKAYR